MKYCRFLFENKTHYGAVEDRAGEPWIVDLTRAPEEDLAFRLEHGRATSWSFDFEPMPLTAADLLPPVTPSKIVCVGRNYRDHVKELGLSLIHICYAEVLFPGCAGFLKTTNRACLEEWAGRHPLHRAGSEGALEQAANCFQV